MNRRTDRRPHRRAEAIARQAIYDALSLDERFARTYPGRREFLRLQRIDAERKNADVRRVERIAEGRTDPAFVESAA